jgi:hypothetical protein
LFKNKQKKLIEKKVGYVYKLLLPIPRLLSLFGPVYLVLPSRIKILENHRKVYLKTVSAFQQFDFKKVVQCIE